MRDPDHARALLSQARKDLRALAAMLDRDAFAEEIFGFHAQQAVEKSLKAWLSFLGLTYPRTHDLGALLELAEGSESAPYVAWDLVDLTDFAVQLRYEAYDSSDEELLDRASVIEQVRAMIDHVERTIAAAGD